MTYLYLQFAFFGIEHVGQRGYVTFVHGALLNSRLCGIVGLMSSWLLAPGYRLKLDEPLSEH